MWLIAFIFSYSLPLECLLSYISFLIISPWYINRICPSNRILDTILESKGSNEHVMKLSLLSTKPYEMLQCQSALNGDFYPLNTVPFEKWNCECIVICFSQTQMTPVHLLSKAVSILLYIYSNTCVSKIYFLAFLICLYLHVPGGDGGCCHSSD